MEKIKGTLTYQYATYNSTYDVYFCRDELSEGALLVIDSGDEQVVKIPISFLWDQLSLILFDEFGKHKVGHPLHRRSLEAFALKSVKHAIIAALVA